MPPLRSSRLLLILLLLTWSVAAVAQDVWSASARTTSTVFPSHIFPDLIEVTVKKNNAAAPDTTDVEITRISGDALLLNPTTNAFGTTATVKTTGGKATATVQTQASSVAIFTVTVKSGGAAVTTTPEPVILRTGGFDPVTGQTECTKVDPQATPANGGDDRCRTQLGVFTGMVIDSFAANELNDYVNPDAASDLKTSFIAGVDGEQYVGRNTWLFLEIINGVRSTDVQCTADSKVEVCQENVPAGANGNEEFLYILRNARALEAFLGARYEFAKGKGNGRFYLKSQLGFLDVAGAGVDVVDSHTYLAGGFLSDDTRFRRSYVEVGLGKSDIFHSKENRRFKFDGFLTAPLSDARATQWFLQMTVDSDFRSGPDSIQIYFGLDFDLRQMSLRLP